VTIETDNEPWSPREASKVVYDGEWKPLRWGLANSRNNYSAWIMKQARQPQAVADFIHKFGIRSYIDPVYALCLGTSDFSLFELVTLLASRGDQGSLSVSIVTGRFGTCVQGVRSSCSIANVYTNGLIVEPT